MLDEPSSNIDLASVAQLRAVLFSLREQGATIIIAEHRLHYLQGLASRYLYFADGRIACEYTPAEMAALSVAERSERGLRCLSLEVPFAPARPRPDAGNQEPNTASPSATPRPQPAPKGSEPALSVRDLRCAYGKKLALDIPHLEISQGEVLALIGASGAGKSTLAKCLCGIKSHQGQVALAGTALNKRQRRAASYLVMQDVNHQLFCESVREELLLASRQATGGATGDESRVEELLERLDLRACA